VLRYLQVTQEPDGHWSQNMWLDGRPYWDGVQMDETALPILLVDLAARNGVIDTAGRNALWPMVRRAAVFLARNGPVSPQDRWEEQPGYTPFTIATEIAALLVAADLADAASNTMAAQYLRETADAWHASIDRWLYVQKTGLAQLHGVDGYYVRVTPPDHADAASPCQYGLPSSHMFCDQCPSGSCVTCRYRSTRLTCSCAPMAMNPPAISTRSRGQTRWYPPRSSSGFDDPHGMERLAMIPPSTRFDSCVRRTAALI
jgi:glucoamylase